MKRNKMWRLCRWIVVGLSIVALSNGDHMKQVEARFGEEIIEQANEVCDMNRSSKLTWVYKEENGKRYRRLYDATNKEWLTDWILC